MRPNHWLCLVLTPAAQALLLLSAGTNPAATATTRPLAILALVIPLGCYLWALRNAPLAPKNSRRLVRLDLLVLVALGLTLGGFLFGLEFITSQASM